MWGHCHQQDIQGLLWWVTLSEGASSAQGASSKANCYGALELWLGPMVQARTYRETVCYRNAKLFSQAQVLTLCHLMEKLLWVSKGAIPPVLLLLWPRIMKNTQSSSKINTLGCYQQNLRFCSLSPRQSSRKPAGVFCMPSIPKHRGKIFPSFFPQSCLFPRQWLSAGSMLLSAWMWADLFELMHCKVKEDKNGSVSVLTFSVQNLSWWQVLIRLWVYLQLLQLLLDLSKRS